MKLADITDNNGTSLQAYAHLLAEKAQECGLTYLLLFVDKKHRAIHQVTNIHQNALPNALVQLARTIRSEAPAGETKVALTDPVQ